MVGKVKTEASKRSIPLDDVRIEELLAWHASYSITMNAYDEAMSEEKRNAHRGVIQQLNRSVARSAPKQLRK